jgi:hypothetical protein
MQVLINFIAFQAGWFASVLGAARDLPWVGPVAFIVVLLLHLRQAEQPELEAALVFACGVIGTWFESFLVATGWVGYPSGQFSPYLAPYWIITMWMLFATTLNRSLGWLRGRHVLAAVLGAISGPASYLAGQKLGGIEFHNPWLALSMLAIGWAVIMPVLMVLAERLDGFSTAAAKAEA